MTVDAEYDLTVADAGQVRLAVEDEAYRNLVVGKPPYLQVTRGTGKATLTLRILVPKKKVRKVVVYVALACPTIGPTRTVKIVAYEVDR